MEQVEIEIEYIPEQVEFDGGELDDIFRNVLDKFTFRESVASDDTDNEKTEETAFNAEVNITASSDPDEEKQDEEQKEKDRISNRKKKLQRRMKIADLKKVSARPDIVEVWDVTSADPKLLVFLKSYRNTVPVPRHWCQKKRFLQGKRGIEKQPFKLPDFIAATGIENIRQAYLEQKKRNQKLGKMDIDYQVLYDAFFKYQTKPKLTSCGDLYYEGKEFEVNCREFKRGTISHKLKEALGMAHVDEFRRTIYGNVFGQQEPPSYEGEPIDKTNHWGDLEEDEEEELELELEDGIQSVESLTSTQTGVETPDGIDLRKKQRKESEKPLYQVLEEKESKIAPETLLGTTHTYVIGSAPQDKLASKRVDLFRSQKTDAVNVFLQPDELEVLENVLPAKYEKAREEEKLYNKQEDLSDMVADYEKNRKRKMQQKDSKSKKKNFRTGFWPELALRKPS